jgi:hypothetical protein
MASKSWKRSGLPDANAHSPNENFPIENFEKGIRLNQKLLEEIAVTLDNMKHTFSPLQYVQS